MNQNRQIIMRSPESLTPYANNARTHSDEQISQISASIKEFGFVNPILIDAYDRIIAGHGRVMAAKAIGMESVPCLQVSGLTEAQVRAYIIADNKLAENSGWDTELLKLELADLSFELKTIAGFTLSEIDSGLNFDGLVDFSDQQKQKKPGQKLKMCPKCGCVLGGDL